MVINVHEREYQVPAAELAAVVAALSSRDDLFWPYEDWPRMRLDPGLEAGATGGHGPVRYRVQSYDPAGKVVFRFTAPSGFDGWHCFTVNKVSSHRSVLRHELRMRARRWAILTWPLFFRPLHDALLEEGFDKAARHLGIPPRVPYRRRAWAGLLHRVSMSIGRPRRGL